jgi:hypothetical protein
MVVKWPKLVANKLYNKILLYLTVNIHLLLFCNCITKRDVLYKKLNSLDLCDRSHTARNTEQTISVYARLHIV